MKFKNPKLKGMYYEEESAKYWEKELKVKVKPSPGSGSIMGIAGDLIFKEDCVLKDFAIDVKAVQGLLTQELIRLYNKNKEDAGLKPSFLEIYNDNGTDNSQPYVFISRRDFCRIIRELDGYRKGN